MNASPQFAALHRVSLPATLIVVSSTEPQRKQLHCRSCLRLSDKDLWLSCTHNEIDALSRLCVNKVRRVWEVSGNLYKLKINRDRRWGSVVEHLPGFCRALGTISSPLEEMKEERKKEERERVREKSGRKGRKGGKIDASPLLGPFETQFCKPWY